MKKIDKDQLAFIVMLISIFGVCLLIKIYSGSLYKGSTTYEPVTDVAKETVTEKVHNESNLWLMVAATAKHDFEETEEETVEVVTEPVTEPVTQYKVVENIEAIVVPYNAEEDALAKRVTEPAVTKATQATTKATEAKTYESGTFVMKRLTYDALGNVIYTAKVCEETLDKDIRNKILESSLVTVALDDGGKISVVEGYVCEEANVGSKNDKVVLKLLVPKIEENLKKTSESESEVTSQATSQAMSEPASESTSETVTEASTLEEKSVEDKYVLYELIPVFEEVKVDGWYVENGNKYYYYNENTFATGFVNIDGLKYYFDENGRLCSKMGVDVSVYQGNVDWNKVKAAGIDFAMVRACVRGYQYAKLTKDTMFDANVSGALAAGLEVGAYVFSQATTDAEAIEEASLIITMCQKYNITGPLIIDVEEVASKIARQNKISVEQRTNIINIFASMVREAGYTPMLYTGESWLTTAIDASKLNNVGIWIAKWSDKVPDCNFKIWQYTQKGKISGITTDVDVNLWITK